MTFEASKLVSVGYGMDCLRILVHLMAQLTTRRSRYRNSKSTAHTAHLCISSDGYHLLMIIWKKSFAFGMTFLIYVGMEWRVFMERGT